MKSVFFILLLISFVASSCKKQYQSVTNSKLESMQIVNSVNKFSDKSILEPIDTTEFIFYWQEFRRAVIIHDVDLLSSLINDTIQGECFPSYYEKTDLPLGFLGNISKSVFCKKVDDLFTKPYLNLLSEYNIKKDLYSKQEKDWKNGYQCSVFIDEKEYSAGISFEKNAVVYSMGYWLDDTNSIFITLKFKKIISGEVKLFYIGCKSNNISAG